MRLSLFLLAAFAVVLPAQAAIIHVDSGTDNGVGCTLREALRAARDDAPFGGCTTGSSGVDTILLDVPAITLFSTLNIESTVVINGKPRHVIGYLGDFLFSPERARTPVKVLSGGERNRLLLARLFAG